ncbi:MAG: DUF6265 family protein [Candidatus Cloacimonetes bacterium]|nr:DUF6265 family protein [Candidatus Cloacimonadota bacterium]MCF7815269.1 DUF6265 family protein [Candidatus Cloacimonadota bacterium]MCF7868104.1 DUF6265 family protein [Candidatus Cloacimonadota bacterium]MCF7883570.1 DUF6265 family protein [Candidatus Cloacimonadota bacterium]
MKIADLNGLTGSWLCKNEKSETEEFWLPSKGNMMLGLNRTVANSGKTAFEFLRIFQQNSDIFYSANPNGREATLFKLVKCEENKIIFENPEHDFPQRIIYAFQTEKEMTARIEGKVGGKLKFGEWKFSKVDR